MLAMGWLTCTFNSIKVPLSNIYLICLIYLYIIYISYIYNIQIYIQYTMTFILNTILCTIILPFNRTTITVKVVSKAISDIVGSCCRSISLLCKILKGIIMYFSPIIHNISMDFYHLAMSGYCGVLQLP